MNTFQDDPIECAVCPGHVHRVDTTIEVAVGKRESVSVTGVFAKCDRCGEVYFAPGEMDSVHRRANNVIRDREELLRPDEIRSIRDSLGLSQAELEHVLRVGPKTVVRWERGTTFQNKATDTLLRALRDVPELAAYLMAKAALTSIIERQRKVTLEFPVIRADVEHPSDSFGFGAPQYAPVAIDAPAEPNNLALVA